MHPFSVFLTALTVVLFFISHPNAGATSLIFNGDRTIELTSMERSGGAYCLWLENAGTIVQRWNVELLTPSGGMKLKSTSRPSFDIPFDVLVQSAPGASPIHVRSNGSLASGARLTSYCEPGNTSFLLQIQPSGSPDLIPGGLYLQRLTLRLTTESGYQQDIDLDIRLLMPERVSATVLESIHLPPFSGDTSPSGEARLCLFRNGGGRYSVRLKGDGEQGAFILSGKDDLHFTALWQEKNALPEPLEPGESSRVYTGASSTDCWGGSNALVKVSLPVSEAQRATSGRYHGRLRIIVQAR